MESRKKILIFCPIGLKLQSEARDSIFNQIIPEGVSADIMFAGENPCDSDNQNIVFNYNKMCKIVLDGNYDKVFIVESDIIPPKDALSKLLQHDEKIVSGYYLLRHGIPSPNIMNYKTISMYWTKIRNRWNQTISIAGGGMGCLLIDKLILMRYEFTTDGICAPDTFFMLWCQEEGIKQVADLSVQCGHIRPDGSILYPDFDNDYRTVKCQQ